MSALNVWAATWQDFAYNGAYEITFYAEDKAGNISSSDAITDKLINQDNTELYSQLSLIIFQKVCQPALLEH